VSASLLIRMVLYGALVLEARLLPSIKHTETVRVNRIDQLLILAS